MTNSAKLIAAQIELEKNMTEQSITNYQKLINESEFNNTKPAVKLINHVLEDYTQSISKYLEDYSIGNVVRRPVAAIKINELLESLKLEQISYIVINSIFSVMTHQVNGQKMSKVISNALENEVKSLKYKKYNSKYYKAIQKELTSRSASVDWKMVTLGHSFNKKYQYHVNNWTVNQRVQTGLILLELFIETTGLVEYKTVFEKGKTHKYIVPTQETLEWIESENERISLTSPLFLPMICRPKDWTGVYDGGYLSPYIVKNRLIKNPNRDYLKQLNNWNMPEVYDAINILQATAWKINTKVLEVYNTLWKNCRVIGGLPDRYDKPIPTFPYKDLKKGDYRTEEQAVKIRIWKNEAVALHKANIQSRSVRLLTNQILRIANQFSQYEKIWFPYQMDFRGRLYPIPALLQPQGNDLAKGLLTFGNGKAINDETTANWLRVHGANVWGEDKCSYEDRVKFIKDREDEIKKYATEPLEEMGWTEADKPTQFLAFCMEYNAFMENGYGYISSLPVFMDGTCNGLQHYSALLRDEVAGEAVNLVDSDKPSDIYGVVAKKLEEKLSDDGLSNRTICNEVSDVCVDTTRNNRTDRIGSDDARINDTSPLSKSWLELGINRKLTKRPVMVLPYGGTKMSCRKYVEEYLTDTYSLTFIHQHFNYIGRDPNDTLFKVSRWLSDLLWEAITETLNSAIVGMDYLRTICRMINTRGHPLEWVTPSGLLIHQEYQSHRMCTIQTELYGSIKKWQLMKDIPGVNKNRQTNGVCPNFIHSLDASALMRYLVKGYGQYIDSFGSVHDSYGTLAADTELSQKLLRDAFVEIYRVEEKCLLQYFVEDVCDVLHQERERFENYKTNKTVGKAKALKGIKQIDELFNGIPPPPKKGKLDIEEVLDSKYFFN